MGSPIKRAVYIVVNGAWCTLFLLSLLHFAGMRSMNMAQHQYLRAHLDSTLMWIGIFYGGAIFFILLSKYLERKWFPKLNQRKP